MILFIYLPMVDKVRTKINTRTGEIYTMDKSQPPPWRWVKTVQNARIEGWVKAVQKAAQNGGVEKGSTGVIGEARFARSRTGC